MASGVPLVTTRVGQATEIVEPGQNGMLVDVDDVEALAGAAARVHGDSGLAAALRTPARATAEAYANERLDDAWAALFAGFGRLRLAWPASARRHARAAVRWVRLLGPGGRGLGSASSTATTACPGRASRRRRHGEVPEAGDAVPELAARLQRPLPRLEWPAARPRVRCSGLARRRGAPVVVNQDGVGYPGWAGARTDEVNRPLRRALQGATTSSTRASSARRSADEFLGEAPGAWEVLHNAVDIERFTPADARPEGGPVLLLGGDQTQSYRLELGLRTFAAVRSEHPTRAFSSPAASSADPAPLLDELGVRDRVELLGRYAQRDAPALYGRAHLLLHTKVNDPCPNVVLEAMACGLPVVYPASGGTRRARRRRGGSRRAASGRLGARRAARCRRRWPTRSVACARRARRSPRRRVSARSSGSARPVARPPRRAVRALLV